jgi:hypothetical protein
MVKLPLVNATVPVAAAGIPHAHRGVVRQSLHRERGIDDAHQRPHHATMTLSPWDDLQDAAIDAPDGEKTMLVLAVASMPHEWAAR